MDKDNVINFGKYKGKTISEVFSISPSYLLWAHNTISTFKLSDDILKSTLKATTKSSRSSNYRAWSYEYTGYGDHDGFDFEYGISGEWDY